MTQLTLQELIDYLSAAPQGVYAPDGFSTGYSYRGIYDDVAFAPATNVSVSEMLAAARAALNTQFPGYKGGTYTMTADTLCWIADRDSGDGLPITREWLDAMIRSAGYETRDAWLVESNTDLTEGRGERFPLAVCRLEATANRMAKGRYVQGSDAPVSPVKLLRVDGRWYGPVDVVQPCAEDEAVQMVMNERRKAINKAKAAGLTEADIEALRRT